MKKSKIAMVAMIIGVLYAIYAMSYWFGGGVNSGVENAEAIGGGIATMLAFPHTITAIFGALMNVIGYFSNSRGFILAAAILYTVSLVLFPPYFFFVVIQMVLCYVAFARMKRIA